MSNALGSVPAQLVTLRALFSGLRAGRASLIKLALALALTSLRLVRPALQADCHWFDPGIARWFMLVETPQVLFCFRPAISFDEASDFTANLSAGDGCSHLYGAKLSMLKWFWGRGATG